MSTAPSRRVGAVRALAHAAVAPPRLRGWSHVAATVPAAAVTVVLVVLSAGHPERTVAFLVYGLSSVLLFAVSGAYHAGRWTPARRAALRRLDHANIFLLIAGTYTPITLVLLDGAWRVAIGSVVWGIAIVGIALVAPALSLHRALVAGLYLAQGWVALAALPVIAGRVGGGGLALLLVAGGLYTVGAAAYATRRPNPVPGWFGYHEVFHVLVIAANALFAAFMFAEVVPRP